MNVIIKVLIILACIFRILSQRYWEVLDNPFIFYLGLATFELVALISFRSQMRDFRLFVDFFIVSVLFDLFKYVYLQPYKVSYNEDLTFIIGLVVILIEYAYTTINNTSKRH